MAASGTEARSGEAEAEVDVGDWEEEEAKKKKKRRAKMPLSLLLPPVRLLSTIFHLPGLYSSASAASWDKREPEWRGPLDGEEDEGKEEEEEGDATSASSASAAFEGGEVPPNSRDEAPTRAPPVPIARSRVWLSARRKCAHAAQPGAANASRKEEKRRREKGAKSEKKEGLAQHSPSAFIFQLKKLDEKQNRQLFSARGSFQHKWLSRYGTDLLLHRK